MDGHMFDDLPKAIIVLLILVFFTGMLFQKGCGCDKYKIEIKKIQAKDV